MLSPDLGLLYGFLVVSPKGDEVRTLLKKQLVELALAGANIPWTEDEIRASIKDAIELSDFHPTSVHEGVEKAISYGTVEPYGGSSFRLTDAGRQNIASLKDDLKSNEGAFDHYMRSALPGCLSDETAIAKIVQAAKQDLQAYLASKAERLSTSLKDNLLGLGAAAVEYEPFHDLREIVNDLFPDSLNATEILDCIAGALTEGMPERATSYIVSLYQRSFYHKMLLLDPSFQRLQRSLLSKWRLYLDTNVLIALLVPTHWRHKAAKEILERSAQSGCELCLTDVTKSEFEVQLSVARRRFRRFLEKDPLVEAAVASGEEAFVHDYVFSGTSGSLPIDAYLSLYCPLEKVVERYSIRYLPEASAKVDIASDKFIALEQELLRAKEHFMMSTRAETVRHDALSLSLVGAARDLKTKARSHTVWFLSFDRSLRRAEQVRRRDPSTLQFSELLEIMAVLGLSDMTSLGQDTYTQFLLGSGLASLSRDISRSVDGFLMELEQISLPQLTGPGVESLLDELALDREVHALMDQFNRASSEAQKSEYADRIGAIVKNYEERLNQEHGRRSQINQLTESLVERDRRIADLEAKLDNLNERLSKEPQMPVAAPVKKVIPSWLLPISIGLICLLLGAILRSVLAP